MRLEVFKDYQQVHIWTGILSGLLLFICFVGGAFTMFKGPLNQWATQTENLLPAIEKHQYDDLLQTVLEHHPEAARELTVHWPASQPQSAPITWHIEDHDTHEVTHWQASFDANGDLLSEQINVSAVGDFIDKLHRTAGIPGGDDHDAVGIFVMGVVCILYFVAIVSGLIIFLPTWIKDLFSLRKGKNSRRFWVDFHNILGVTALPFHIIIAVTTIVFAYHDIFYGSIKGLVYQEKPLFDRPAIEIPNLDFDHLVSLEALNAAVKTKEPEFEAAVFRFAGLGTPRSRVLIGGKMTGEWIRGPEHAFAIGNPYSTEPGYTEMLPSQAGPFANIVTGFFTLHFGGFGGNFVYWLYFALGLSGSLLFLTGNIIWIESRRKKSASANKPQQNRSVIVLARLTVGATLGCFIGICIALLCAKLIPHSSYDIVYWQKLGYYLGFLGATSFALSQVPLKSTRILTTLLCLLLIAIAAVSLSAVTNSIVPFTEIMVALISLVLCAAFWLTNRHLIKKQPQMIADGVWRKAEPTQSD